MENNKKNYYVVNNDGTIAGHDLDLEHAESVLARELESDPDNIQGWEILLNETQPLKETKMKPYEAIKAIDDVIGKEHFFTEDASNGWPDENWEIWITPIIDTKNGKRWLHSKKFKIRKAGQFTPDEIAQKAKDLTTKYPKGF